MSEIHYFPRYSVPENLVTNNTLLLLLRLHEYSRAKFEKFMAAVCRGREVALPGFGLQFRQQVAVENGVVDGYVAQDSVKIVVETKLTGSLDPDQLRKYLAVFRPEQHNLLVLLSPSLGAAAGRQLESVGAQAEGRNVQVVHTSFEGVVAGARECLSEHDEEMHALVDDYESFCSGMGLLPRDAYTLFVPPCGQSFAENEQFGLYYCPSTWSRRKAKYLGIYAKRTVRAIGEIAKVVACDVNVEAGTVTVPSGSHAPAAEEEQRILGAARGARVRGWDLAAGYSFYLCDALEATDFRKRSPGGIQGHRYFDLEKDVFGGQIPSGLADMALLLRHHTWA